MKKIMSAAAAAANSWWSIAVIALVTSFAVYQHWQMTHPRARQFIRKGEEVSAVTLQTTLKSNVLIDWKANKRGTIVYYTSPDCVWCQRNVGAASAVYHRASALGYRFIGISLKDDGLPEYLLRYKIGYPVYLDYQHSATKALQVVATPETIFISPAGKVQEAIVGAYKGKNAQVIAAILGMAVPEVPVPEVLAH